MAISNSPLLDTFTYHTEMELLPGERVMVNFAARNTIGYVIDIDVEKPSFKTKAVMKKIDNRRFLSDEDVKLAKRAIDEFLAPPGKIFDLFFPPGKFLKTKTFVIPKEESLPFDKPMSLEKAYEKYGKEQIKKWKDSKKVKLSHSFEKKITKTKKREKVVRLSASLSEIERSNLTDLQKKVVDHLFGITKETPKNIEDKLNLKSRSPINTLLKKGLIEETETDSPDEWEIAPVEKLNKEQTKIKKRILENPDIPHLIHGFTGTGKTEVYFKVMEYYLNKGKSALYMVPEVALTPQLLARIRGTFPGREVRQYHSYLTPSVRRNVWLDAFEGNIDILVGTRSSLWVPMKNTGIIVVDEEHDSSFYQHIPPHYNAVDVALFKSNILNIPIILGSATPRITHYYMANNKSMLLHELKERPVGRMPELEIIDMTEEKDNYLLSSKAKTSIKETLEKGNQVFAFVNRKGFSNYIVCMDCGHVVHCPNCDISMTYHKKDGIVKCHYCGYKTLPPTRCEQCGSKFLSARGFGTERIEHELQKEYPDYNIMRMDRETISNPTEYEKALRKIESGKAQIIVGTKMISKGLDFPDVGLVIVVDTDRLINLPSYDSTENAFQVISQVSGRSGRGTMGKSLIQTFNPGHRVIKLSISNDFKSFYESELPIRNELEYPPFSKLVELVIEEQTERKCQQNTGRLHSMIKEHFDDGYGELLPPVVPVIKKLSNRYRRKIYIKLKEKRFLRTLKDIIIKSNINVDVLIDNIGSLL